jgi:predicted lipoprotein with Yx(FWY)xxD motif
MIPLIALAGCGGGSNKASAGPTTKPVTMTGKPATIGVANTGLGKILVDTQGRTVYLFAKDTGKTSTCTGACASAWPPVTVNGTPTAGRGANSSMVGTTTRSDGTTQVTYDNHPLYRYVGDQKAGDTSGQGVNAFGAGWFALSSSGTQVNASPTGSSGY